MRLEFLAVDSMVLAMPSAFETLGFGALVAGVTALTFAARNYCSASEAGHRFYARLGIAALALSTLTSALFVTAGQIAGRDFSHKLFLWAGSVSRINRTLSPLVIAALVVYLGRPRDSARACRNRRVRHGSSGGVVGSEESDEGISGRVGRERQAAS